MGFVDECIKLKDSYSKKRLISYIYNHYHYIVDKVYIRNNGKIKKKDIEEYYKKGILDYIEKDDFNRNPSQVIHNKLSLLEKTYKSKLKKRGMFELEQKAYSKDFSSRKELLMKHADKIDKKAIEIFEEHFDCVDLEEVALFMYYDMWDFVNRFFDNDKKGYYFSTKFSCQLYSTRDKVNRNIDELENNKVKTKKGRV